MWFYEFFGWTFLNFLGWSCEIKRFCLFIKIYFTILLFFQVTCPHLKDNCSFPRLRPRPRRPQTLLMWLVLQVAWPIWLKRWIWVTIRDLLREIAIKNQHQTPRPRRPPRPILLIPEGEILRVSPNCGIFQLPKISVSTSHHLRHFRLLRPHLQLLHLLRTSQWIQPQTGTKKQIIDV